MSKNKTVLIGFAVAMVALVAGVYTGRQGLNPPQQSAPVLAAGTADRLFASTLNDPTGKPQSFAQWKGKILVVNFWATWCPPCREEMPEFSRLHGKYVANGVQFVGIALDSQESVNEFSRQFPVIYPLLIGANEGTDLAQQLGNPRLALPYTVIINGKGEAIFARLGGVSEQELDTLLQQASNR
jgi:thiol-disulfide isomerase/thioredoxin